MIRPKERLLRKRIPKEEIRRELERWSDRLSHWNEFFTGIVVLGLAIEYLPDAASFLGIFSHAVFVVLRGQADPLRQFGGLLVVLGVAGELWSDVRGSKVETDLREEANAVIGELHNRAANAEKRVAELNLLAEQERLARIKLEQELSPRWFENQHEAIERLKVFNGTEVTLRYPPDLECARTAEQIAWVLAGAGWKIKGEPVLQLNPLCEEGITIEAMHASMSPVAGTVLMDVLIDAKLDARWPPGIGPRHTVPVIVWVGMKPSGLSSRLNKHSAAMDREVREVMSALPNIPDTSQIQAAIEKYTSAMKEETKDLKPGMHGNRLGLPRWPITPLGKEPSQ